MIASQPGHTLMFVVEIGGQGRDDTIWNGLNQWPQSQRWREGCTRAGQAGHERVGAGREAALISSHSTATARIDSDFAAADTAP